MTAVEQLRKVVALLRSWGYKATEEPGWATRHGNSNQAVWRPCLAVYGVEHWTASPNTSTAYLRDGDPQRGLRTLCNVQVKRDGTLHLIAGGYANHAGYVDARVPAWTVSPPMDRELVPGSDSPTYSANGAAIGMEGNAGPGAPYTADMHAAAAAWWAACCIVFGWSATRPPVLGHKEITKRKPGDPSHDMAARRRQIVSLIADKTIKEADAFVAKTPLEDEVTTDQAAQIIALLRSIDARSLAIADALTPGKAGVKYDGDIFAQLKALVAKPAAALVVDPVIVRETVRDTLDGAKLTISPEAKA